MNIITGIYKITSPSEKVYIGQSEDINDRWNAYKRLKCEAQPRLYNSFMCYGVEAHTFEIIKECESHELNYYERHFQEFYYVIGEYGLNCKLTKTDDKSGVASEETKKKQSEKKKGKKLSEDHKQKLSDSMKGKNLGKTHSEETRKKISERTKESITEEVRKKLSENSKGKNSKKVINIETNDIYNSVVEMCKILGFNHNTMRGKLSGHQKNNTPFRYLESN
jgi:group I intron endonuclease